VPQVLSYWIGFDLSHCGKPNTKTLTGSISHTLINISHLHFPMSNRTRRAVLLPSALLVLGFILAVVVPLAVALTAPASVFVVSNIGDSGTGSLRQAILDANAHPGADSIIFNIPGSGPHTIRPSTALPTISDSVTIDGSTQPGFTGSPIIELDGSRAGANADGLRITAGNSVVSGLVINRFSSDGVELSGNGGNVVEGSFIGTDATGTVDLGNAFRGLNIASSNNTLGGTAAAARNVISGNDNTTAAPGSWSLARQIPSLRMPCSRTPASASISPAMA
jgi:hypothetical protein